MTISGKELVTLVTCDTTGANRLIVQGELVRKAKGKDAPKYMQSAFETDSRRRDRIRRGHKSRNVWLPQ